MVLMEALQRRGPRTIAQLALELGVSERTVRRDIGRLNELDVPVETRPGRRGGVALAPGASLSTVRFTDDELLALAVGLKSTAVAADEKLERAAARAMERLELLLSPSVRARSRALQRAVMAGRREDAEPVTAPSQHVIALAEAASEGQRVSLDYRSGAGQGQITRRDIDPYGLAMLGAWYVVAFCHLRQDLRTFRVDRIRSITPTSVSFVRPEGFDAYRYVNDSIAMAPLQGDLVCRAWLGTDLRTASGQLSLATVMLQPATSGVMMTVRTDLSGLEWVLRHLLRLRCEVRIEGPEEFRHAAQRMARRLMRFATDAPSR